VLPVAAGIRTPLAARSFRARGVEVIGDVRAPARRLGRPRAVVHLGDRVADERDRGVKCVMTG
jgi:hypothetical protein